MGDDGVAFTYTRLSIKRTRQSRLPLIGAANPLDHREGIALATANLDGAATRDATAVEECIRQWCAKHVGRALPITCCKDYGMIELWDDRCIQVIPNTGRTIADEIESERMALSGKSASP